MTSLEILKKQIELETLALKDGFIIFNEYMENINSLFNECKILHKKEIINSHISGNWKSNAHMIFKKEKAEKYYNEKYEDKTFT
jgi:hypothetical protein